MILENAIEVIFVLISFVAIAQVLVLGATLYAFERILTEVRYLRKG